MKRGLEALVLVWVGAVVGCVHPAEVERKEPPEDMIDALPVDVTSGKVVLHPNVSEMCSIRVPEAYFKSASATLSDSSAGFVDKLAECIKGGALRGNDLKLIGRADPRGSEAYNLKLGKQRAQAIANALIRRGVAPQRLQVVSRGEAGFVEDGSEQRYANERRVDIQLVNPKQTTVTMVYWDSDNNGAIEAGEFFTYFSGMYDYDTWDGDKNGWLGEQELSQGMFRVWDADLSGALSRQEYERGSTGWFRTREGDDDGDFARWDTDNSGEIDKKEWGVGFTSGGIFASLDLNKDGRLLEGELSEKVYRRWDTDGDSVLDEEEIEEMYEQVQ